MKTNETHIKELNAVLKKQKATFHAIEVVDTQNYKKFVSIECKIHGKSSEWANPWFPISSKAKKMTECIKCNKKYKQTKEEVIKYINENHFSDGQHEIIDIPEYKNRHSRCEIVCKTHGLGSSWANPWTPTVKDLKSGYGCPHCSNNYACTKEETIEKINKVLKDTNLTLIDIPNYKNKNSRCHIKCDIHGNGWELQKKWSPIVKTVINSYGCPFCAFETKQLKDLVAKPEHYNSERFLYFIQIKKTDTKEIFYKIGINNSENIYSRFYKSKLLEAKLEIKVIQHLKLNNIKALLTEFYIINKYHKQKKYQSRLKKYKLEGSTECFDINILEGLKLEDLVEEARLNHKSTIEKTKLPEQELSYFYKYMNKVA